MKSYKQDNDFIDYLIIAFGVFFVICWVVIVVRVIHYVINLCNDHRYKRTTGRSSSAVDAVCVAR